MDRLAERALLNVGLIKEEAESLLAQGKRGALSWFEKKRLRELQGNLKQIPAVLGISSEVIEIAINLSLPQTYTFKFSALKTFNSDSNLEETLCSICGPENLERAIDLLSSIISDDDFIMHFPAYLQVAAMPESNLLCETLLKFCNQVLQANCFLTFEAQKSNIPFLCNVLVRVAHNRERLTPKDYTSFSKLITKLRCFRAPPITTYQLRDSYKKVLATSETLVANYKVSIHQPIHVKDLLEQPLIVQMGIDARLSKNERARCQVFLNDYQAIQIHLDRTLEALAKKLAPAQPIEDEYALENEAGQARIDAEEQQRALAGLFLKDKSLVQALQDAANKAIVELTLQRVWEDALTLANQGPADKALVLTWSLARESGARVVLTKDDLRLMYSEANFGHSQLETGLSPEKVQQLHECIHKAFVHGICCQTAQKVKILLEKALLEADVIAGVFVLDLLSRSKIPGLETPAIVILEHEEGILLFSHQDEALKTLRTPSPDSRGFKEMIVKVPTGGGKSKVIRTALAQTNAQGGNVVLFEEQQALLATGYENLNRASSRLYGKRAYRFNFNRDSNISPTRLEQIYVMFIEIMLYRNYLVATGESMQSLELKYIELLVSERDDETLSQQIYWLDKITDLIFHLVDCLIDEVQEGLSIKKRLNYVTGETKPISLSTIKNTAALFKLIGSLFVEEAPHLDLNYDWTAYKKRLAERLLNDRRSTLYSFAQLATVVHGACIQSELVAYLTNTSTVSCIAVEQASLDEKETLAFFRREISKVLEETLVRNLYEKYGPSKCPALSAIERTLPRPYLANNVVKEQNRFGNTIEAVNYTAQMMMISGLSQPLIEQQLAQWQILARKELIDLTAGEGTDDTPTAGEFRALAPELNLKFSEIDLGNIAQLEEIYHYFRQNPTLIFSMLEEYALGQVHEDSEIISSNSFNHVGMYGRSVQGFSGTPVGAFPLRLKYNKAAALGRDGYVIGILNKKNTPIRAIDYITLDQFISELLTDPATRAIIAISATLLGLSNEVVAQATARFYQNKNEQTIRQVLHLNEERALSALGITNQTKPIISKTTNEKEMDQVLGSRSEERFTYFDQLSTVGTDIAQAGHAGAEVLVDEKLWLSVFIQGLTRMRQFALNQKPRINVPLRLKGIELDVLCKQYAKNEQEAVLKDYLNVGTLEMSNVMRRHCLRISRRFPASAVTLKKRLAVAFRPFLVIQPCSSYYELYGKVSIKQTALTIFTNHKKALLKQWDDCLTAIRPFEAITTMTVETDLQAIIDACLPFCLGEYENVGGPSEMTEVQTENRVEIQTQLNLIQEVFDPSLKKEKEIQLKKISEITAYSLSLNELCSTTLFSEVLRASQNYMRVYLHQKRYLGGFLKPALISWYYVWNNRLHAMVVTPQELEALIKLPLEQLKESWFATSLDTVLAGMRPIGRLENEEYLVLREQLRFFNGEIGLQVEQFAFTWLRNNTDEKLDFFKRDLMPYRPGSDISFSSLKSLLSMTGREGYHYLLSDPFKIGKILIGRKPFLK